MNNGRNLICLVAVAAMLLTLGYKSGSLNADEAIKPAKIGVVSIGAVMQQSKGNAQWVEKMKITDAAFKKEINDLQTEIQAIEEASKKFKPNSDEFIAKMRLYMEKRTQYEQKNNFYNQDFNLQKQIWAEKHFRQVIAVIEKVAKERGIDVILAKENFDIPNATLDEVMLTIRTSKVLYSSSTIDLTADVLAALDAAN